MPGNEPTREQPVDPPCSDGGEVPARAGVSKNRAGRGGHKACPRCARWRAPRRPRHGDPQLRLIVHPVLAGSSGHLIGGRPWCSSWSSRRINSFHAGIVQIGCIVIALPSTVLTLYDVRHSTAPSRAWTFLFLTVPQCPPSETVSLKAAGGVQSATHPMRTPRGSTWAGICQARDQRQQKNRAFPSCSFSYHRDHPPHRLRRGNCCARRGISWC